ncbi:hypothetical protein PFICI_03021 [Pestalotiopsis fici W106-1]|uniref:F-box domain-containing protein n=1 Tax=Pestalotiopsis fici (strain W106-1 / CGMCC3.15140) TaxID=1229662 RepID=W3XIB7_PESFW|nr:uncharacterized protein PFICI_03021 [Pestalotiopsis fici W106-1]ETS84996.1 hypothetical protein PFICI_03021 [Pestalotiopsis fici W106-1]
MAIDIPRTPLFEATPDTPSVAPTILCISAELLDMILESLSKKDLYSTCLVNKHLRSHAERFLYFKVCWKWCSNAPEAFNVTHPARPYLQIKTISCGTGAPEVHTVNPPRPTIPFLQSISRRAALEASMQSISRRTDALEADTATTPPAISFLQSISRRPELADFVQEAALTRYPEIWRPEYDKDYATLRSIILEKTEIPYQLSWVTESQSGSLDASVALILAQARNIKRLEIPEALLMTNSLTGMVIKSDLFGSAHQLTTKPNVLCRLSNLEVRCWKFHRQYREPSNQLDPLFWFYLPSIQSISVFIDNPTTFSWPGAFPPTPSNLTTLELDILREGHLGRVLSVTKNLRRLAWTWSFDPDTAGPFMTNTIDLTQIASDLSHVQHTLTCLEIKGANMPRQSTYRHSPLHLKGSLEPLASFCKLEDLRVPFAFLTRCLAAEKMHPIHHSLPSNLQHLEISSDLMTLGVDGVSYPFSRPAIQAYITAWLEDYKPSAPHLLGVDLRFMGTQGSRMASMLAEWMQRMRDVPTDTASYNHMPTALEAYYNPPIHNVLIRYDPSADS